MITGVLRAFAFFIASVFMLLAGLFVVPVGAQRYAHHGADSGSHQRVCFSSYAVEGCVRTKYER